MNGLDLDLFLRLIRFDQNLVTVAVLTVVVLGIGVWAGFGSRKLLRKCLILSIVSHLLLVRYGQPLEWAKAGVVGSIGAGSVEAEQESVPVEPGIRSLEIVDLTVAGEAGGAGNGSRPGNGGGGVLPSEISQSLPSFVSETLRIERPALPQPELAMIERPANDRVDLPAAPVADALPTTIVKPERPSEGRPGPDAKTEDAAIGETVPAQIADQERPPATPSRNNAQNATVPNVPLALPPDSPTRVMRSPTVDAATALTRPAMERTDRRAPVALPPVTLPESAGPVVARRDLPKRSSEGGDRPKSNSSAPSDISAVTPAEETAPPVPALSSDSRGEGAERGAVPNAGGTGLAMNSASRSATALPDTVLRDRIRSRDPNEKTKAPVRSETREAVALPMPNLDEIGSEPLLGSRPKRLGNRPLQEIPAPYRSRLDPNKARLAIEAGASTASEKSVEMALDWLRKHQDADGRWDGGVAKYRDGTVAPDEDSFTVHCPPGEICFGECFYWEADTALTGLSLLAYLGAGYTHTEGKYADTVARGLDFLIRSQKPSGDLRGRSKAVGMYCHAMATLAVCEAFALTGDERLKGPAQSAVAFLVDAQAEGGAAWRYEPKAPVGDTSILGWAVLALRSGRAVGFPVPDDCIGGVQAWLDGVGSGKSGGLSRYQPWKEVTPTMTAEAWVCRWFLKLDPNAKRNREAADYLIEHGPDRDPYNLYYWYYGTLAMYQQGGDDWRRWNDAVRDRIVRKQRTTGHMTGSWDPDDSQWGTYGGRIYSTALATMTLEVYYRFLRTYDESK